MHSAPNFPITPMVSPLKVAAYSDKSAGDDGAPRGFLWAVSDSAFASGVVACGRGRGLPRSEVIVHGPHNDEPRTRHCASVPSVLLLWYACGDKLLNS